MLVKGFWRLGLRLRNLWIITQVYKGRQLIREEPGYNKIPGQEIILVANESGRIAVQVRQAAS